MKILFFSVLFFMILAANAQSGINYKALIKDGGGAVLVSQSVTVQFSILRGVAQTNVYQETHSTTTDANGFVILNIGEGTVVSGNYSQIAWGSDDHFLNVKINTGAGLVDMGTTQFMAVPYALNAANVAGLEAIDEGNGIGYRLKGTNPTNYNNIGENAVDLSINPNASEVFGASGNYATAMGANTTASGSFSTALGIATTASGGYSTSLGYGTKASGLATLAVGSHNIGGGSPLSWTITDPIFEVGNGSSNSNRSNALTVLKNGKVGIGNNQPVGFLEVKAANSTGQPNLNLIHEGTTGARINFSNTDTTNGNLWTLYGDSNDTNTSSYFNVFHPNAPSNGNILQLKGDGKVGINGSPDMELHIHHGSSGGLKLENSGTNGNWWRFATVSSTGKLQLFSKSQGNILVGSFDDVSGTYTPFSDRRLKKNFKDLHFNWADFMKLETLTYQFKVQEDTKEYIGLVAQDVEPIYPELVNYTQEEDVYHLDYSGFGVIAVKAVQELKKEVSILKEENALLKQKLNHLEQLEARLTALETDSKTENETLITKK